MKRIMLSVGQASTLVDDQDYERLSQWKWTLQEHGKWRYAIRLDYRSKPKRKVYMHREILKAPSGLEVDHADGNGLNNQRANLRLATGQENRRNQTKRSGCTSRYKGVYKQRRQWRAKIKVSGREIHLGCYAIEEDAARAYDNAAREWFGKFAKLNFMLLCCLLLASSAYSGEPPSWFSYRDSTVQVHVCNELRFQNGYRTTLSEFAPAAGAAWAKEHGRMDCYMFPVKVVGVYLDGSYSLSLVCGRRTYSMIWATWWDQPQAGTVFARVVIPNDYRLRDVTGFVLEGKGKRYILKPESKLR